MKRIVLGIILAAGALFAQQPTVALATNAASYARPGLPNGGLAQGSLIAIFGTNLAAAGSGVVGSGFPFQTSLQGTSARIGSTDLLIVYVSPNQIGAIVPSTTPISAAAPLTVTRGGQTSAPLNVGVVARALGVFTLNQAGSGPMVGLKFVSQASQPPTTLIEAMNRGGVITIFGTGLGAVQVPDGQPVPSSALAVPGVTPANVEVLIGGVAAPVEFVGRAPGFAGLDQINVRIPPTAPLGCYIPVLIRVAGVPANATSISIAAEGRRICSDPNGLTEAQLERAIAQGALSEGYIGLNKIQFTVPQLGDQKTDTLFGSFRRYTLDELLRRIPDQQEISLAVGTCRTYVFSYQGEGENSEVDPITGVGLDAGANLLATAGGRTETIDKPGAPIPFDGTYIKTIFPGIGIPGVGTIPGFGGTEFLTTGVHRVTGPGGPQVGAFAAEVNWPVAYEWTNRAQINSVTRSNGLTVNWTGGDPAGYTAISGYSAAIINNTTTGAGFACLAPNAARTFSVPPAILSVLPVTGSVSGMPLGNLTVFGVGQPVPFTASGLDVGYIYYSSGANKTVQFQ
jgi:uncharacterized protein (TIGR03437 family)